MDIKHKWYLSGCILGPLLLNILINDIDKRIKCTLSNFVDDTKLSSAVDTPERQDTIEKDSDKLEKRAHGNLTRFNKTNCKVLQLGQGNSQYQYMVWDPTD
ncbi:rna-directed dna polymerase from mobile element jockey-like [Willisornis vidua]|uniref:Rna-directed dna polymerase from mobile element jockey-like n=1 Tax=Willisornis vidua TaxID=1566151 RepID=A0ABQ9CUT1_9PASS|nr:rna-directed dna polymerase from mobile element jockey-like [Willisornis vidua]